METNEQLVRDLVARVLEQVQTGWGQRPSPPVGAAAAAPLTNGSGTRRFGQFTDVDEAVAAAATAQQQLARRSVAQRKAACDAIRRICIEQAEALGRMEFEETRIGRLEHKAGKLRIAGEKTPGVESLRTDVFSGDCGITLQEYAPWGVIGVVTPVTHSLPTLANNAICMLSAGNALVCNPHPSGARIAAHGARLFNEALYAVLGIDNLVSVVATPTMETAAGIFSHPRVRLLAITGGPGVVAAALRSGKRAICAGPGNPPVVVDASADLDNAARCIIEGAAFDNNLLCLAEKEVFLEAPVWERGIAALKSHGGFELSESQMNALADRCLAVPASGHPHARKEWVGKGASELAGLIGLKVPAGTELLFGPTGPDHPWVHAEQMMACVPIVKAQTFEHAVALAKAAEHGFRHTAILHSRLVDHMTFMGKEMDTTLFVKNGPSTAGDGLGGEGYATYSIACSTGEGVCTPMTYTRLRRCAMVEDLRII